MTWILRAQTLSVIYKERESKMTNGTKSGRGRNSWHLFLPRTRAVPGRWSYYITDLSDSPMMTVNIFKSYFQTLCALCGEPPCLIRLIQCLLRPRGYVRECCSCLSSRPFSSLLHISIIRLPAENQKTFIITWCCRGKPQANQRCSISAPFFP